ncbi:BlaI/MecI/CopY family transcriptional regulator [Amycolatopsis palatopharyngis]|uniref:BlaI/MecI/CopY family transcriptional regulator n=1 Tax=Amycolatopsis palatopharyngis TaxID=187982 RepID=UPI000E24BBEA|nr:BlaI/MecI/CopY family transcriptional regulator [Amycolatopsis palatopharyngis]
MRGFGELEAVVMDRVWDREDTITVRDVFESLKKTRQIAYTTVMSTMDNLHRKGSLARTREGKAFLYWPTLTREENSARLMRAALESGGNPDVVLSRFFEQMTDGESSRLHGVLRRWASAKEAQ